MMGMKNDNKDRWMLAGFCSAVVVFALLSKASPYGVTLFGFQLPVLCPFRWLTGWDCPICGLTRSLILAFHGHFQESYLVNIFGIPAAVFCVFLIPYEIVSALSSKQSLLPHFSSPKTSFYVLVAILTPWTIKTIALAFILWR
jgi:Protein of unknown function (DUF2752)